MSKQMIRRRNRDEVREILGEYYASGQTQRDFAEGRGIGVSTLSLWLRREREGAEVEAKASGRGGTKLVEVSVCGAQSVRREQAVDFEIEFGGGERLRVRRGFEAGELWEIVAAIRGAEGR